MERRLIAIESEVFASEGKRMTGREWADALGVSMRQVLRWSAEGTGRFVSVDRPFVRSYR